MCLRLELLVFVRSGPQCALALGAFVVREGRTLASLTIQTGPKIKKL